MLRQQGEKKIRNLLIPPFGKRFSREKVNRNGKYAQRADAMCFNKFNYWSAGRNSGKAYFSGDYH
jgi:hypothetical protein